MRPPTGYWLIFSDIVSRVATTVPTWASCSGVITKSWATFSSVVMEATLSVTAWEKVADAVSSAGAASAVSAGTASAAPVSIASTAASVAMGARPDSSIAEAEFTAPTVVRTRTAATTATRTTASPMMRPMPSNLLMPYGAPVKSSFAVAAIPAYRFDMVCTVSDTV